MLSQRRIHLLFAGILVAAIAALLASVRLGGDRPTEASQPLAPSTQLASGSITVWSWNVAAKSLRSLLPAFGRQHRGIAVTIEMNGTQMESRFLLSLAAGTGAPDVMQLQGYEAPRYTATDRLTDLTAVAARYQANFPAASWANCVHNGRVYAIPWDLGPCAVFYKRDVFERCGIHPEQIATWDDFIEAGKAIVQKSAGHTRLLPLSHNNLAALFELLMQQLHGQVFDESGRVAVDSPQSLRVLRLIRRMQDAGLCANVEQFSHEWMAGLTAQTVATYPGAAWLGATIKDTLGDDRAGHAVRWGVMPLPAFDRGGPRVSNLGGSVLVIPNQSAHKAAAWDFVEFALCDRHSQASQYADYDLFPALLPALGDPVFQQPDPFYGGQHVGELFASGIEHLPIVNRTTDWVEANDYLVQALTAWETEHQDSAVMLRRLSATLSRRLHREVAPASSAIAAAEATQ